MTRQTSHRTGQKSFLAGETSEVTRQATGGGTQRMMMRQVWFSQRPAWKKTPFHSSIWLLVAVELLLGLSDQCNRHYCIFLARFWSFSLFSCRCTFSCVKLSGNDTFLESISWTINEGLLVIAFETSPCDGLWNFPVWVLPFDISSLPCHSLIPSVLSKFVKTVLQPPVFIKILMYFSDIWEKTRYFSFYLDVLTCKGKTSIVFSSSYFFLIF